MPRTLVLRTPPVPPYPLPTMFPCSPVPLFPCCRLCSVQSNSCTVLYIFCECLPQYSVGIPLPYLLKATTTNSHYLQYPLASSHDTFHFHHGTYQNTYSVLWYSGPVPKYVPEYWHFPFQWMDMSQRSCMRQLFVNVYIILKCMYHVCPILQSPISNPTLTKLKDEEPKSSIH